MNEQEREFNTQDLEDILKEFGSGEPDRETAEEPVAEELQPEIPLQMPDLEPETAEEAPQEVAEEPAQSQEAESEAPAQEDEQSAEAEPAEAVQDVPVAEITPEEIPPEPIVFRPRSRLRELKRQLIAGPEKRYYELVEMGVGKLQLAMIVCLIVIGLSVAGGVLYAMDMVPENRMRLMVFGQILAMMLGALMGYNQILDGISDLFHGKFTMNTLLFVTLIACVADGVFCLLQVRMPCCAAFSLA